MDLPQVTPPLASCSPFKDKRHAEQTDKKLHVEVLSQSGATTRPEKQVILQESMVKALES